MSEVIGNLQSGSKDIEIRWDDGHRVSETYILTRKEREKKQDETTNGYREVLRLLQEKVNREGKSLVFQLSTSREPLKRWAEDPNKGLSLVGKWDTKQVRGNLVIFRKTINPQ